MRIAGICADIRTGNLPNTRSGNYWATIFGLKSVLSES